jgi:hypothetical protein
VAFDFNDRGEAVVRLPEVTGLTVPFGPRDVPWLSLLDDWAAGILELRRQVQTAVPEGEAWTYFDILGMMSLRAAIERGLGSVLSGDDDPPRALTALDTLFRDLTVDDPSGLAGWVDPDSGPQWWWRRIPTTGPVADHVRQLMRERQDT